MISCESQFSCHFTTMETGLVVILPPLRCGHVWSRNRVTAVLPLPPPPPPPPFPTLKNTTRARVVSATTVNAGSPLRQCPPPLLLHLHHHYHHHHSLSPPPLHNPPRTPTIPRAPLLILLELE
nr:ethylene-responsive transcription factor ABI4-like [Penaeus vannamei]